MNANSTRSRPERAPRWARRLAVLLCTAAIAGANAQDPPATRLETVTVTGSRLASATAVAGTAIERGTIDARDKPTVPLLLADAAGVYVTLPGGRGSVGEVLLRGAEPNFSAVLVDGVQMNDPTNTRGGSFDFATLAVDEIETIEVLTGPLSSIYGSDALGGAINVVTRPASDRFGVGGTVAAGSDAYARYAARMTGPMTRRSTYRLSATSARDGQSDSDANARNTTANGRVDFADRDDRSHLSLHARRSEASFGAFPDSSGGPEFAVIRERDNREAIDSTFGGLLRTALSSRHELNVSANALDHDEAFESPGVAPGPGGAIPANRSRTEFARRTITAYVNSSFSNAVETAFGMSLERQTGSSSGSIEFAPSVEVPTGYALERDNEALFFEVGVPVGDALRFDTAVRIDDSDVAGSATTRRFHIDYRPNQTATRLHLTAAEGYKLPSLFALGDPLTGNAALRPETATSWEIGVDVGTGTGAAAGTLGAALFAQRFDDLIDFDFDTFQNVNRDRVETNGIEIHGRRRIADQMTLLGSATWLAIDVAGTTKGLRQRPERYGSFGIEWLPRPAVSVYSGLRYAGPRLDESIPTGERTLGSYTQLDLAVRWRISPTLSLGVAVDDLGDERFEDAIGFPSLGRRIRLSLSTNVPAT